MLIPSFSSKGFGKSKKNGKSEISKILTLSGEFLTEYYLISAYDIFYGHIPKPQELPYKPELIFLDSGGYEVSTDKDYSSVIDPVPAPEPWDLQKWESIVNSWPDDIPVIIVSYDHHNERMSFINQVNNARKRFRVCREHFKLLLLKPETSSQTLLNNVINSAIAHVEELESFDIIGVTEKELGRSVLDRMVQIARLRKSMDSFDISIPIHVFGALDPISVCLYFIAGAEIFDGLTWIRYGYEDGLCVYIHNLSVYGENKDISITDDQLKSRVLVKNYYYLKKLRRRLQEFEVTKDWDKFDQHNNIMKEAWDSLKTRLERRS